MLNRNAMPSARFLCLAAAIAFALIVWRRPEAIVRPQFWAEDGAVCYADAYNLGPWVSLLRPHNGYFHTFAQLAAAAAAPLPLAWAPLAFNLLAIAIQILPVILILSARSGGICPDFRVRIALALLYLALPYSAETHAIASAAKWRLALSAFLVLTMAPSPKAGWRVFDMTAIVLCGLSGPFALLLAPAGIVWLRFCRAKWTRRLLIALLACAAIQTATLWLTSDSTRDPRGLGASVSGLIRILGGQIFLGAMVGLRGCAWLARHEAPFALYLAAALFGLLVLAYAAARGPAALRLYILFCALLIAASLTSPMASKDIPQWHALATPGAGGRYWFHPILAFLASLVWMAGRGKPIWLRAAAIAALCAAPVGILGDWRLEPFEDMRFGEHARRFDAAPPGARIDIPINPKGWEMSLTKK